MKPATNQLELTYDNPPDPAAVATVEEVKKVVAILECGGHVTAAWICREMGLLVTDNNKRKVRAIARAAFPGILSFVGSDGYKLLRHCTIDEAWAADAALATQERDATIKRKLLQDAIHSGKVGTP